MALLTESSKKDLFILKNLISKDFKLKYRRSALGILWSVLNPLLMMMVIAAVFSFIFRFEIENFAVYLIVGLTLFNLMANSTSAAVMSIIGASGLIKKIRVNKLIFPLNTVLFELLNYGLSFIAVVAVMIFFQIMPSLNMLFFPLLLLYVLIFCVGLSLLLSALTVFFRDIIHLWGVVIIAWTYVTPLFYPVDVLAPWMQTVMQFNPMYQFITYLREILMWGITPTLMDNLICLGMALVTLLIGFVVFRKTERKFILHV
ncbi:MAG TPA: ABC transporter [Coriobacteriia bacterium]|nr:ABC transporter [Coriobacteriia bacterium]